MPAQLHSPLHDRHTALGAKLADFGGWEMPIEYQASGGGVLKEHEAVRSAVGVFDVSHLGKATVRGPGARAGRGYMAYRDGTWDGRPVRVCRTGYTGEHGYELIPTWSDTPALWDALVEQIHELGGMPAGLGARDTLRTEMGYPLHGQDLSPGITPVQARLTWAVGWKKAAFWGRQALLAEREAGPRHLLWGILAPDKGIPRPNQAVLPEEV